MKRHLQERFFVCSVSRLGIPSQRQKLSSFFGFLSTFFQQFFSIFFFQSQEVSLFFASVIFYFTSKTSLKAQKRSIFVLKRFVLDRFTSKKHSKLLNNKHFIKYAWFAGIVTHRIRKSPLKDILERSYFFELQAPIKQKNDQEKQEKSTKNEKFFLQVTFFVTPRKWFRSFSCDRANDQDQESGSGVALFATTQNRNNQTSKQTQEATQDQDFSICSKMEQVYLSDICAGNIQTIRSNRKQLRSNQNFRFYSFSIIYKQAKEAIKKQLFALNRCKIRNT